jgi:hypothetical protein
MPPAQVGQRSETYPENEPQEASVSAAHSTAAGAIKRPLPRRRKQPAGASFAISSDCIAISLQQKKGFRGDTVSALRPTTSGRAKVYRSGINDLLMGRLIASAAVLRIVGKTGLGV